MLDLVVLSERLERALAVADRLLVSRGDDVSRRHERTADYLHGVVAQLADELRWESLSVAGVEWMPTEEVPYQ